MNGVPTRPDHGMAFAEENDHISAVIANKLEQIEDHPSQALMCRQCGNTLTRFGLLDQHVHKALVNLEQQIFFAGNVIIQTTLQ
jgi:hypothetical protein